MKRRQQDSSSDSSSSEDEKPTVPAKRAKNNAEETVEKTTDDLILHPMFDYLEKWKNDRANWKFNTNKQTQLLKNCFNDIFFPQKYFKLFLEYIIPMKSNARKMLFQAAKDLIRRERLKAQDEAIEYEKKIGGDLNVFIKKELEDNRRYGRAKIVYKVLLASETGETLGNESCVSDDE